MAKGQIYIRKFPDKSFYVGQTNNADAENQYNRTAAHTAAACHVNIYKGQKKAGDARWKKADTTGPLDPEDQKIRDLGLKNINYDFYDIDSGNLTSLANEFTKAGFYSTRKGQRKITRQDKLDIAEISFIYYYLNNNHELLNRNQGGKHSLAFCPEKTAWGKALCETLHAKGKIEYSGEDVNLGINGKTGQVSLEANSLYQLLKNKNEMPESMQNKIKEFIQAVANQYIYQYLPKQVASAFGKAYSGSEGANIVIDSETINEIIAKIADQNIILTTIKESLRTSGENLSYKGDKISRVITKVESKKSNLITAIQEKFKNTKWRSLKTFKNSLIKFLRSENGVSCYYTCKIDYGNGYFTWKDSDAISSAIDNAVNGDKNKSLDWEHRKYRMVYGVCFAICYYIYQNQTNVNGLVLTVDGQEVAVRHPRGSGRNDWYSTYLLTQISDDLPDWVKNNWIHYYDAAMALYHETVHSSQMILHNRDSKDKDPSKTNRYYFSNLDLNRDFEGTIRQLAGFPHLQSKTKEREANELQGEYKGNYYYYVSSGSIFELIDAKNQFGVDYIQRCYNDLYNLS